MAQFMPIDQSFRGLSLRHVCIRTNGPAGHALSRRADSKLPPLNCNCIGLSSTEVNLYNCVSLGSMLFDF